MKPWVYVLLVLIAAGLAVGIYRAGEDEIAQQPGDTNQMVVKGGKLYGRRLTSRSWTASYDRMTSNADQTIVDVFGVHDGILFSKGKPAARLTAHHMTVNLVTHDFTADGPMHAETIGKKLRRAFDTDAASWIDAAGVLTFPKRVTIYSGVGAPPLVLGSGTYDVRTGDIDAHDVAGAAR